jgi:hypothetical protein
MQATTSQNPFYLLVGRALIDENYRDRVLDGDQDERRKALEEIGVTPTDEILKELGKAVDALRSLEGAFGPGTRAA